MNKFNVIDQTTSLEDLEKDYVDWSNLPYNFRKHSDDDCMRKHGMANKEYYEQIKAKYLMGSEPSEYIGENEQPSDLTVDYIKKVELTKQYSASPNINMLIPNSYSSEDELVAAYEPYQYLGFKSRLMSDEYSRQIWGYTVSDIFNMEKEKFTPAVSEIVETTHVSSIDKECSRINSYLESLVAHDNKIELLQNRIHQYYSDLPTQIRETYVNNDEMILNCVNQVFDENLFYDYLPSIVPYFTPDEMIDNTIVENMSYSQWKKLLLEAVNNFDTKSMMNLGWNPGVEFTTDNLEYAKKRQLNWLSNHLPKIINIQNVYSKFDKGKIDISKDCYDKNFNPIFFAVSTGTGLDWNAETRLYISTNASMFKVYIFDGIFAGIGHIDDNANIELYCVFVDEYTKNNLEKALENLFSENNDKKVHCQFGNIMNFLYDLDKYPHPEYDAIIGLKFMDLITKIINSDKLSNVNIMRRSNLNQNIRIFKLFSGLFEDYDQETTENDIKVLFGKKHIADIKYNDRCGIDFSDIDNKSGVIESLNMIDNLLQPERVFVERFFPVKVTDKGDITIEFNKNIEQQYQEIHKTLTSYDKSNIVGIKSELAHLFYLNSLIEKKIQKMKKGDSDYKTLINLRARILNDFKTYMKIVMKEDPEFDFGAYFKDSEYYNGAVTIDNKLLKLSGNIISKFLSKKF